MGRFEECQKAIESRQNTSEMQYALRGGPSVRCQVERIDSNPFTVQAGSRALPSHPDDFLMNAVPPGTIEETIFTDGEVEDNWALRLITGRLHKPGANDHIVHGATYIVRRTYRGSPDTIEEWWISGIWVSEDCNPKSLIRAIMDAMSHPQSYPHNKTRSLETKGG